MNFEALSPLRERLLELHERSPRERTFELELVELVDALERAQARAHLEIEIGENFDNRFDCINLHKAGHALAEVSQALQKACETRISYYRW